jgi:hypothetical protein
MRPAIRPLPLFLGALLCTPAQEAPPKFQLKVIENASQFRKAKKGRVSSEVAIEVRDANDKPVSGVVVAFTIPQLAGGGAAFTNGTMLSTMATNSSGVASTGFSAGAGANFNMGITASVPGSSPLTASVPISVTSAMVASGGGLSGTAIAVLVGAGAAAAVGVGLALGGGGGTPAAASTQPPVTPPGVRITGGAPVFGPPR